MVRNHLDSPDHRDDGFFQLISEVNWLMEFLLKDLKLIGFLRGGGDSPNRVPESSLGILRVPQLPPPLEHPPLKNPRKNGFNYTTEMNQFLDINKSEPKTLW